jgi:prepilin-type N-terminal cleavage/methylation domain-containing protein
MKQKSGFTLIELLLVLAIIGIISAIAIPALLGQRARARDKASLANATAIVPDFIAEYDKLKDSGATPTFASLTGTAAAANVPEFFLGTDPWDSAVPAYFQTQELETSATAAATNAGIAYLASQGGNMGQVYVGYMPPAAGVNGVVCAAVTLNSAVNGSKTQVTAAGLD